MRCFGLSSYFSLLLEEVERWFIHSLQVPKKGRGFWLLDGIQIYQRKAEFSWLEAKAREIQAGKKGCSLNDTNTNQWKLLGWH